MSDSSESIGIPAGGPAPEQAEVVTAASPEGPISSTTRETVSRAELDKVIRERQAAKSRARAAEAQLAALRERLAELEGGTGIGPVVADAAGSEDSADDGAAANNAAAAGDSVTAPQTGGAPHSLSTPQSTPAADKTAQADLRLRLSAAQNRLEGLLKDQVLHRAALEAGAINPDQVVALLRPRVRMAEGADGQLAPQFLDDRGNAAADARGEPIDAGQFVRAYLMRPENANLVRAGSAGGSGARLAGGPAAAAVPQTLADFNSLPPHERRQAALRLARRQREALLGLQGPGAVGYL